MAAPVAAAPVAVAPAGAEVGVATESGRPFPCDTPEPGAEPAGSTAAAAAMIVQKPRGNPVEPPEWETELRGHFTKANKKKTGKLSYLEVGNCGCGLGVPRVKVRLNELSPPLDHHSSCGSRSGSASNSARPTSQRLPRRPTSTKMVALILPR